MAKTVNYLLEIAKALEAVPSNAKEVPEHILTGLVERIHALRHEERLSKKAVYDAERLAKEAYEREAAAHNKEEEARLAKALEENKRQTVWKMRKVQQRLEVLHDYLRADGAPKGLTEGILGEVRRWVDTTIEHNDGKLRE